ncbi:putative C-_U-editing enzyme APOBEC-4 [Pleurodeles waltl]|uniref:putative C->U-editing enzyme APOBEC-4 n=1 Tax=Pleurodeles waltl TaxID=8319 RepID=UPI0037098525
MENIRQQFLPPPESKVHPYHWQSRFTHCAQCPSHICTAEDARIPYVDFYRAFCFPYGPAVLPLEHITFFEVKTVFGSLIQKGYALNCALSNLHPESVLFDVDGYLDLVIPYYDNIGYITLYSNYTPCNEYGHYCLSKMYDFLNRHPNLRLDIYFSLLYHTEDDFATAAWNRGALRSLASLWPQVTINPLSGRVWHVLLRRFVKNLPESTLSQPILPARASVDRYNTQQIHAITGIPPYFDETLALVKSIHQTPQTRDAKHQLDNERLFQQAPQIVRRGMPLMLVPHQILPSFATAIPHGGRQNSYASSEPKYVVRHERMPQAIKEKRH